MFNEYTRRNFDSIDQEYNSLFGIRHLMYHTLVNFDPHWKKRRIRQRLIQTDRASNHPKRYIPPPGQPPESC